MKLKVIFPFVLTAITAVLISGCSKEKMQAKSIAKAFFEDVIDDNYTSASRFVHEDDLTALYENWKDMTDMIKGADDWSLDVELTSKTKGKAVCTAEFGKGKDKKEVAVSVDLRKKEGEWWIKVAPNPRALEERAKKIQEIKDKRLKEEYFGKTEKKEESTEKKEESTVTAESSEKKTETEAKSEEPKEPPTTEKAEETKEQPEDKPPEF